MVIIVVILQFWYSRWLLLRIFLIRIHVLFGLKVLGVSNGMKDKTLHLERMAVGLLSPGEECPLNNCLSTLTATDMRLSPIGTIARDGGHSGRGTVVRR